MPSTARRQLAGIRHRRIKGEPSRILYAVTAHDVHHLPMALPMLEAIDRTAREGFA